MNKSQIWLRLGITLQGSKEEIESIITGDEKALRKVLESGSYTADGDTYIPQDMVAAYNNKHNAAFEENDIDFEL